MARSRHRVIAQLFDGFTHFGGDTVTRAGASLRGTPGYAVALPWVGAVTALPHRRWFGEWYDRVGATPFDSKERSATLRRFLAARGPAALDEEEAARFSDFPAAYGVWRDDAGRAALSVSVVIPERQEAVWWGRLFAQVAVHGLKEKADIRLQAANVPPGLSGSLLRQPGGAAAWPT